VETYFRIDGLFTGCNPFSLKCLGIYKKVLVSTEFSEETHLMLRGPTFVSEAKLICEYLIYAVKFCFPEVTGCGLDDWVSILGRTEMFLFATTFRPAVGLFQFPIRWVQEVLSRG
jgi:hypothetical protein